MSKYHNFNAGMIGVFLCGVYNSFLLFIYIRLVENAKKDFFKYILIVLYLGSYSAFNIGINTKMWDMLLSGVMILIAFIFIKILFMLSKKEEN